MTRSDTVTTFDVAVIGAGPAGLAAAAAAVTRGARVALVDGSPRPGGQYWRHRDRDDGARRHAWPTFVRLRSAVAAAAAAGTLTTFAGHQVWHVEGTDGSFAIHLLVDGVGAVVRARTIVLATGAYDRQLPFPGWTLPGVYTAGAAQALLKGSGVLVGARIAVAGTGPFLLPVATGLAEAGAEVVGVFEAGRPTSFARHPVAVLRNASKLVEGAGYLRVLRRHRVPYRMRATVVEALGETAVTGVRVASLDAGWRAVPGSDRTIACDAVAVGYGFTPQTELPVQLGCEMVLDADGSLVARVDDGQASTVDGIFVAGEACGVGGADLAVAEGELAGVSAAARATGLPARQPRAARRRRSAGRAFARAMHEAFAVPPGWQGWVTPETVVCRCEEISAGRIHEVVSELGAADPRAVKLFARPGMGLCQGRVCGYATACLVASAAGRAVTAADLAGTASRPIAQPVPLAVIAGLRGGDPESGFPVAGGAAGTASPRTDGP
ncbi:MAG TPA: NAD(P)/FAD-dependent oxidoreductase [Candidatus Limnocylindrales bacterium]|nr:NAD(P)/FAD-dependent oxidoreductase [Candidatus Limnocylindrales bacterium]